MEKEVLLKQFLRKPDEEVIIESEKIIKPFSLGVSGNFTLNPKTMNALGIATGLYLILVQLRVKNKYQGDRLKIYDRYWKRGLLATGYSRGELCKRLGISREQTITDYAKRLEKNGIIKIDRLHPNECFDGQQHKIYIVGEHKGKKNESFYIEKL